MQFYHDWLHIFPATYTRERKTHSDFAGANPGEQPSPSILPSPLMQSLIIAVNESMYLLDDPLVRVNFQLEGYYQRRDTTESHLTLNQNGRELHFPGIG